MLTRIEIDGFKTFSDFSLDLGPFVFVFGLNASGKSNLFDAIRLLSNLATTSYDVRSAFKDLRGEPHEMFSQTPDGEPGKRMSFAIEVLLNPTVRDPYNNEELPLLSTRIRYEITLERSGKQGSEKLHIVEESAQPISRSDDRLLKGIEAKSVKLSRKFQDTYIKRTGSKSFLDKKDNDLELRQDGAGGRRRKIPLNGGIESSVLSGMTTPTFKHMYALREELKSWRFLQLDPMDLRLSSSTMDPDILDPSGSNLPTVLARIRQETQTDEYPMGALSEIRADMASLIPGITNIEIDEDRKNKSYNLMIGMRNEPPLSAKVASDGTLRILALLTILHDPRRRGIICMEEPENGVHPHRLKALISLLRELTTDFQDLEIEKPPLPLSQLILNSHSPIVLSMLKPHEIIFFDRISRIQNHKRFFITRARYHYPDEALSIESNREAQCWVGKREIRNILNEALPLEDTA